MAPTPLQSFIRRSTKYRPHHSSSGSGASLSGGVIAAILGLMLLIFICVFIYKYRKGTLPFLSSPRPPPSLPLFLPFTFSHSNKNPASRIRTETKAPIKTGKILLDSFLIALTFGVAACCCAECVGGGENGNVISQQGGGEQVQQGMTDTGFVFSSKFP